MSPLPLLSRAIRPGPPPPPVRLLQFGEGNFLRAFAGWMVDIMNERVGFDTSVAVVQPIREGKTDALRRQDGLYTVILRGNRGGQAVTETRLVRCVGDCIDPYRDFAAFLRQAENPQLRLVVSNTTEAGIVFRESDRMRGGAQNSFPGKLTLFLERRYRHFRGGRDKGLTVLPCELIERNGEALERAVLDYARLWRLGEGFIRWVQESNRFYNTLVDRIVTGFPAERVAAIRQELGYGDELIVEGELFHLWLIEAPEELERELPARRAGLNVRLVDDLAPYRQRKVRIMNGAHTCLVPTALPCGLGTVREALEHPRLGAYVRRLIFEEILPTLTLPPDQTRHFAEEVLLRFANPFIDHRLQSIALNSISKWRTRVLPTLKDFLVLKGVLPEGIVFSLAALIAFYGGRGGATSVTPADDPCVLQVFERLWVEHRSGAGREQEMAAAVLADRQLWGEDLGRIEGLAGAVGRFLRGILARGTAQALEALLQEK